MNPSASAYESKLHHRKWFRLNLHFVQLGSARLEPPRLVLEVGGTSVFRQACVKSAQVLGGSNLAAPSCIYLPEGWW